MTLKPEARSTDPSQMDRLEAVLMETTNVAQATLAAIVESSDDAIMSTTLDHNVLTWNAGATSLYGYEAAEVIGRNVSFLVPQERAEEMQGIVRLIAAGEDVRHVETVRVRKDGSRVPVALAVWPLRDGDGRLFGAASLAHDITERLQLRADLEEARDAALRAPFRPSLSSSPTRATSCARR